MGSTEILWAGYPKSYTKGRVRKVQYVCLHYTAGHEGPTDAENGVSYDKRRTDGTSTHYFTDSLGPALQEVPDGDRSHCARYHGNEIGIHIEICGTRQTREQWLDSVSKPTLETTAYLTAVLLKRHNLAFKLLTVAETRAAYYNSVKPTGITDHSRVTQAYPEDNGDHMDVGTAFPWDVFLDMVSRWLDPNKPVPPSGGGNEMYCKYLDKTPNVKSMQLLLLSCDPTCLPNDGADGDYGGETAAALVKLKVSATDGKNYGPEEYAKLLTLLATLKGPKHAHSVSATTSSN